MVPCIRQPRRGDRVRQLTEFQIASFFCTRMQLPIRLIGRKSTITGSIRVAPQHRSPGPRMTEEDIEELYEHFRKKLHKFFLVETRDAETVKDLMQEIYRCLLKYPPPAVLDRPFSYLITVAWNVLNDSIACAHKHPPTFSCDPVTLDELAAANSANLWFETGSTGLEATEKLERALKRLRQTDREAILLRYRDGLSYQAIAARMQV